MPDTSLDIEFTESGSVTIATIVNATMLDATNVISFGQIAIEHVQSKNVANILINFENIQYMSSAGLTELLRINEVLKPHQQTVHLWGLSKDIHNVFRITNLDNIFVIHCAETLEEAASEFNASLSGSIPAESEAVQPGPGH